MRIEAGHHLLLEGRNGTGKSSLFRTMGELWPLRDGMCRVFESTNVLQVKLNFR